MKYVVLDFETASAADLNKIGAWKYAQDFSTMVLCVAYKVVENRKPQRSKCLTEVQIHRRDAELWALANDPEVIFVAHNASFEQAIWKFQMEPLGYPALPPERWHDTLAVAAMKGLPLGLGALCKALELPDEKDNEGHRLMMIMCKPDKNGGWSQHNDYNLDRLYRYCIGDVDAQYGVHITLQGLGPSEREVWVHDQYVQQGGVLIDRPFVEDCMDVLDQVRGPMTERFVALTGVKPTQRAKILEWVNASGLPLDDMKKQTIDAILDPDDEFTIDDVPIHIPGNVLEAMELRRSLASSSVAKLSRMLECASYDGRVRYTTQYHVARTGRDGGRLIQVQNFPRGSIASHKGVTADSLAQAIQTRDVSKIKALWGDNVFEAVISSLRSCIVPEKGKVIIAGDFAAVEARNVMSMAGQHDRVQQMHEGADAYNDFGSLMFERPFDRKGADKALEVVAKGAVLGAGYGLGYNGFHNRFIPKQEFEMAKKAIDTYRNDYAPMVPKFWYGLFDASVRAVWCEHGKAYSFEGVEFRREPNDFLSMRLPSGRKLWYHRPRREKTLAPSGDEKPAWSFMSYQGKKFRRHLAWHGMVTADCIQGSARDLMTSAMVRARKAGLNVIFKVHDELVFEMEDTPDICDVVKQVMEDIDPWAIERKFKVKAEVEKMLRYKK